MHCKACGNYVGYKRKKPATTFTGGINSITKESVIKDFPKKEQEDLCSKCLLSIRDCNSDLSEGFGHLFLDVNPSYFFQENYQDRFEQELSDKRLDVEFEYVQDVYNGWK